MLRYVFVTICILGVLVFSSGWQRPFERVDPAQLVVATYQHQLQHLIEWVVELESLLEAADQASCQAKFLAIRQGYKQIELVMAYHQPELTLLRLNGAPLPKVDPMQEIQPIVIEPVGLQVMDEVLFDGVWPQEEASNRSQALLLAREWRQELEQVQRFHRELYLSDRQVMEACRDQLLRIYTLGLTGFDTPGSGHAMADALTGFQVLELTLSHYLPALSQQDAALAQHLAALLAGAVHYLSHHQDFDRFDRLHFLRSYLDPLFAGILEAQLALDIETMYEVSDFVPSLNYFARHLFSDTLLQTSTYLGGGSQGASTAMIELGRVLFFDPILSQDLSRSCASCHQPQRAFSDGQRKSLATGLGGTVDRNAPTLVNAVYSDRYFHDLRSFELEMQIDHVIHDPREFNTSHAEILQRLRASAEYRQLFAEAFPPYAQQGGSAVHTSHLKSALAAYVASLRGFHSPFDRYARGESDELDASAKRGYNLFMGKAVCGTCHFAPAFTGLLPPTYQDSESEVLGVPAEALWEGAVVDPDLGRSANGVPLDAVAIHSHSFKTPTVRNIALTAPYMHNGVYDSLEQVLRFYQVGGGAGIGIDLPHQTLPFDSLALTPTDLQDLMAFLHSLTDTTGMTAVPTRLPHFEGREDWNSRKIGGEY